MTAFRLAREMGADFVETDLRMTRDGHMVAMHDATVKRTTNGRGRVSRMTLAQLQQLDAGGRFRARGWRGFAGERVPTIEEILHLAKDQKIRLYLELKSKRPRGMEVALAEVLRKSGHMRRIVVISFDAKMLARMRRAEPKVAIELLTRRISRASLNKVLMLGGTQILPRRSGLSAKSIALAHDAGLRVVAWTADKTRHMKQLIRAGVDGIVTNYPDRLNAALSK